MSTRIPANELHNVCEKLIGLAEESREAYYRWAVKQDDVTFWSRQGEFYQDLVEEAELLRTQATNGCLMFQEEARRFRALATEVSPWYAALEEARVPWGTMDRLRKGLGL
jgi:hypothetical protein